MPSRFLLNQVGDVAIPDPEGGFASRGEQEVYYELVRRIGREAFRYAVYFHDIPTTPGRDEKSAEFVIPALDMIILVNSEFTHPDPEQDRIAEQQLESLGYRVYWLWDYQILADMGGDVREALDRIPGLGFFGQTVTRVRRSVHGRKFGQPPRVIGFKAFEGF